MMETQTESIDGIDFSTTQLPAMRSFNLLSKLLKILSPLLDAHGNMDLDADIELAPMIGQAMAHLGDNQASALALEIFASTTAIVGGEVVSLDKQVGVDKVFTGQLMTMMKVLFFVLKVNYSDFFGSALASVASAQPAKASSST